MKYLIFLTTFFITSCCSYEDLELCAKKLDMVKNYNKDIVNGEIVKYKKSQTNDTVFFEFKSQISSREANRILLEIKSFSEKHKQIGKFEFASNAIKHKEVFKKEIKEASEEIGAKYTLAYKFHKVSGIDEYKYNTVVSYGNDKDIYYLILFFVDKDE